MKLKLPIQSRYQVRPRLDDQWQWVKNQMELRILQWIASGVSTNDLFGLVRRAKLAGSEISRFVYCYKLIWKYQSIVGCKVDGGDVWILFFWVCFCWCPQQATCARIGSHFHLNFNLHCIFFANVCGGMFVFRSMLLHEESRSSLLSFSKLKPEKQLQTVTFGLQGSSLYVCISIFRHA